MDDMKTQDGSTRAEVAAGNKKPMIIKELAIIADGNNVCLADLMC